MMKLSDKAFKTAVIDTVNMFKYLRENIQIIRREMKNMKTTKWNF